MNVSVEINGGGGTGGRGLAELRRRLSGAGRRDLIAAAGYEVQRLVTDHLRGLARTRHKTAQALGAAPSNHWAAAAEKVAMPQALRTLGGEGVEAEATVTVDHPGIARAFHDVTIRPVEKEALVIAVHPLAYNRRASQVRMQLKTFVIGQRGRGIIAMKGQGKFVIPLYVLARSVTQRQDRSLLPSGPEMETAAGKGARNYIAAALEAGGNL